MALTERYVTQAGTDTYANSTNSGTPMSLATAFANAAAGDRINILSDSAYSIGATTITNAGTRPSPIVFRGYNTTIGDLDNLDLATGGTLVTTDMPAITLTGTLLPSNYVCFQNLNFSGALSSALIGNSSQARATFLRCGVTNTQNNASARCIYYDTALSLYGCDFSCTGAAHAELVNASNHINSVGCRYNITQTGKIGLQCQNLVAVENMFLGNSGAIGILFNYQPFSTATLVSKNTFYAIGTAIQFANSIAATNIPPLFIENHCTDCSKWMDNLYSATANVTVYEIRNRLRDVTTARTGIESVTVGEISTDTGGAETDYTNAGSGNFYLITTAPGYNAGLTGADVGAFQTDPPASAAAGGFVIGS